LRNDRQNSQRCRCELKSEQFVFTLRGCPTTKHIHI
jgi:hypothetical protein